MSDFSLFESDEAAQAEPRLAAKTAGRKLEAAIDVVRRDFGRFLLGATGIDEFGDRWHLSKHDIRAAVEPYVFPNTGTMRRVMNAMKADWKLAHPYKVAGPVVDDSTSYVNTMQFPTDKERNRFTIQETGLGPGGPAAGIFNHDGSELMSADGAHHWASRHYAEDRDAPFQDLDETYHPSGGNLIPEGDFHAYEDSVDQGGPEKVEAHDFTPGGDSGSDRHARLRHQAGGEVCAVCHEPVEGSGRSWTHKHGDEYCGTGDGSTAYPKSLYDSDNKKEARRLKADSPYGGVRSERFMPGSDRHARRVQAGEHSFEDRIDQAYDNRGRLDRPLVNVDLGGQGIYRNHPGMIDGYDEGPYMGSQYGYDAASDPDFVPADYLGPAGRDMGGKHRSEAARLVADIYTDFAQSNGLRVASLDTLDTYAETGIANADYRLLASLIVRANEEAEEAAEGDDESDEGGEDEAPDFGGEEAAEGDDEASDEDEDGDDDGDEDDGESDDDDYEDSDDDGQDDSDEDTFTVPQEAPDLDPQLMQEIPQDDTDGTAPIPPEVIDSLLGLPEGTIEQLLLEEVERGMGGGGDFGGGQGFGGDDTQGGGDDFFGPGGGDNTEPPRVARRRQVARQFWAADDDQDSGGDDSGQDAGGGDPTGGMGADPSAMMGGGMMPPPGSQSVQPPQPPMPLENQPAEDALLDTANQAITQMIDRETQEFQQIIDPLSQALQAVQFAQQVEQSEHPLDVTPPQGTVDTTPAAAPGGANGLQQQLAARQFWAADDGKKLCYHPLSCPKCDSRGGACGAHTVGSQGHERCSGNGGRQAKIDFALRNAARLIATRYKMTGAGERLLLEAMGRRQYEHAAEALQLMPTARYVAPEEYKQAAAHLGELFAADNPRFNKDVWMRTVTSSRGRLPFDRPRLAGETWVNMPIPDTFEFDNDKPQSRDNMTINDLPKMPGGHVGASQRAVDRFQRWETRRQQMGLPSTDDDAAIHNFLQTSKPYKNRVGDEAASMLHRDRGLQPDAPVAPKAKPLKAVNPVLKGKGGKPPAAPKAPKIKSASFFTRRVPGWKWDDHLSGYISKEAKPFACSCGQKVAAPSYKSCDCGRVWNVTAIGDTHHLASDTADFYVAREIPVRPGVVLASKNMEAGIPSADGEMASGSGSRFERLADWTKYDDDVDPVAEAYGKSKIPSTKAPKIPRDWSRREPNGTWKNTNFAPKKK